MATIEIEWRPTREKLRGFGDTAMFLLTAFALVLHFSRGVEASTSLYLCAGGATIYLVSRLCVSLVKPVYVALMLVTFPIGYVVSHVVLAAVFYLVLTPIGLIFRLSGRDPLERNLTETGGTSWVRRPPPASPMRYFRQF